MKTRIAKWGNSLAVRIPREVVEAARLKENQAIEVSIGENRTVVLQPLQRPSTLADFVARITPDNRHGESTWGKPKGNESW